MQNNVAYIAKNAFSALSACFSAGNLLYFNRNTHRASMRQRIAYFGEFFIGNLVCFKWSSATAIDPCQWIWSFASRTRQSGFARSKNLEVLGRPGYCIRRHHLGRSFGRAFFGLSWIFRNSSMSLFKGH